MKRFGSRCLPMVRAMLPVALKVKKVAWLAGISAPPNSKLPAGVSTDKIWVRFDGYAGLNNHGLRIDDFKLYEGGNGSETRRSSVDYTKGTVAELSQPEPARTTRSPLRS